MRSIIKALAFLIVGLIILILAGLKVYSSEIDDYLTSTIDKHNLTVDSLTRLSQKEIDQKFDGGLSKSINDFMVFEKEQQNHLANLKTELEAKFKLREVHYQEYKCECDGTCGTGKRGRGSECENKEQRYLQSDREYHKLKMDLDSLETKTINEILTKKETLQYEISDFAEREKKESINSVTSRINALWHIVTGTHK
jgi:hypothetical protein